MRLDPRPEESRQVEERRSLEVAGALEVVLVARRQAELETRGRTDATLQLGQLVLAAQQDVAHADRVAPGGAGARRLGGGAETLLAGQLLRAHLALDAHAEIRVDDGDEQVDVQVVEHAVGEAERADVAVNLEAVAQPVGGRPEQVAGGVELLDDDPVGCLQPLDAAAVELVELDVLVADVDVELAPPERIRPLEEDRTEGLRRALEDLELRVVAVRVARGGRDDRQVAGRRIGDVVGEGVEGGASADADGQRAGPEAIAERRRRRRARDENEAHQQSRGSHGTSSIRPGLPAGLRSGSARERRPALLESLEPGFRCFRAA